MIWWLKHTASFDSQLHLQEESQRHTKHRFTPYSLPLRPSVSYWSHQQNQAEEADVLPWICGVPWKMIQGPSLAMPWMDGILKSDGSYESWWSYLIFECSSCAAWPSVDFLMGSYSIMIWSLVTLGLAKNFGIAAQRNVSLNSREKKHHRVYI